MANVVDSVMPKIIAMSLVALREMAILPRLVNQDYSEEAKQKGQVIYVPLPQKLTVSDVVPGPTPPAPASVTSVTAPITLSRWRKSDFHLTAKQMAEIDAGKVFTPGQVSEAVRAIANDLNAYLFSVAEANFYGYTGTPATTPFASTTAAATNARKILNKQLCPPDDRSFVMDPDAEANALSLPAFQYYLNAGTGAAQATGDLGMKFGFNMKSTTTVPTHVAGTGTSYQTNGSTAADPDNLLGSDVAIDTGSGTVLIGDIVTFGSDPQTYCVTKGVTTAGTIHVLPGIQTIINTDTAMTIAASHVLNIAMHRNAIALAIRTLEDDPSTMPAGTKTLVMTDDVSGIPLRLDMIPGYYQTSWQLSILYGASCLRPQLGMRIAG